MADDSGVNELELELYLRFENDLTDSSSNARDQSTAVGAPEFDTNAGEGTYSYNFRRLGAVGNPSEGGENGGNYIQTGVSNYGDATLYPGSADAWSVAFAVRAITTGRNQGYFVAKSTGFPNSAIEIGIRDRLFVVLAGHVNWYSLTLSRTGWTHIAVTWDGTSALLYVSGTQVATLSVGGVADPAGQITFGGVSKNKTSTDVLRNADVGMDELRLYGRTLSALEVAVLAQFAGDDGSDPEAILPEDLELHLRFNDDLLDSSGNGRHQTDNEQGGTVTYVDGKIASSWAGDAATFIAESGVTGYGAASLFADAGSSWSIAAWVNVNSMSVGVESSILSRWVISPIKRDLRFVISNVSGTHKLQTQFRDGTVESWGTLTPGTWHHAGLTWDGSAMTIYLDGVDIGNPTPGSAAEQSADVLIGAEGSIGSPLSELDGEMDDLRVYSDDLTAAEMALLAGLGPPFDITLAISSVSGDVATITATFEREPAAFVLGDITVTGGSASNLSGSGTSYTFDVTGTSAICSTVIAAAAVQDLGDNNNTESNTVTFAVASLTTGGMKQFDRTGTSETITGSIVLGPIKLSQSPTQKEMLDKAQAVLGRASTAVGSMAFAVGRDAEDAINRVSTAAEQYTATLATLDANDGICYPKLAGHALAVEITQTSGHLIFEQMALVHRPAGPNKIKRT